MEYLHIKNLEKYHPGYKDRTLIWCKVYFKMVNADPDFEMLSEIDKWRFIAFIMLELQAGKPIPLDNGYLKRKGFNIQKRSVSKTVKMLDGFIEIVTKEGRPCYKDKVKVKKKSKEKKEDSDSGGYKYKDYIEDFVEKYNEVAKQTPLPQVLSLSESRKEKLRTRFDEEAFKNNYEELLKKVAKNDFLNGSKTSRDYPNWKADFNWLIKNDTNYLKVLEGKYKSTTSGIPDSLKDYIEEER